MFTKSLRIATAFLNFNNLSYESREIVFAHDLNDDQFGEDAWIHQNFVAAGQIKTSVVREISEPYKETILNVFVSLVHDSDMPRALIMDKLNRCIKEKTISC